MSEYENLLRQIKSQVPVDESFDLLERKLKIGERDANLCFSWMVWWTVMLCSG